MDIEVRLAEKRDLDIIHGILEEIQHCEVSHRSKRLAEALDSHFSTYLVAVSAGKVIGFLNIWHLPDLVDGGYLGIVLDIYVSSEYRKRGVGEMLLNSAVEVGKKFPINKYYGWVDPNNKPAILLLHKFGFVTESLMLEKRTG